MEMRPVRGSDLGLPAWLPKGIYNYLAHAVAGQSIRSLARSSGLHASTVLRQIRQVEADRDDPLLDRALQRLDELVTQGGTSPHEKERTEMNQQITSTEPFNSVLSQARLEKEGRRILRRLCERGATLAVAQTMEKAVVVRDLGDELATRSATVDREVAEAMALMNWISPIASKGKICRYQITSGGRSALKDLSAKAENDAMQGLAEAPAHFHPAPDDMIASHGAMASRTLYQESPLVSLSRRRMKSGEPFLCDELVGAGERLREDYELALMLPGGRVDWEQAVHGKDCEITATNAPGAEAARDRVLFALRTLGPGLGDVALRCCCYLEGLETVEREMCWSARSGKIVLRIALQRLNQHYKDVHGRFGPMIG